MEIRWMCQHQNYRNPCPENFKTRAEARDHYFKAHGLICKYCEFGTISYDELEIHLKEIHDKVLKTKCKHCQKIIEGFDEFIVHCAVNHKGIGMKPPKTKTQMTIPVDMIDSLLAGSESILIDFLTEYKRKLSLIIEVVDYKSRDKLISLMVRLEKLSRELDDSQELHDIMLDCDNEFLIYQDYYNTEKSKESLN
jgi:hypothetical protein